MKRLVGTWELKSVRTSVADGRVILPFGETPKGLLIYHENGFMSVNLMKSQRARLNITLLELGSLKTLLLSPLRFLVGARRFSQAAGAYQSYAGRYEVTGDKVVHQIDVSLLPDMEGSCQERDLALSGNTLVLTAKDSNAEHRLEWLRVER